MRPEPASLEQNDNSQEKSGNNRQYFESYTQMPNQLIDDPALASLSPAAFKVFAIILRKTLGFHKPSDKIANSQFTGLNEKTIKRAAIELENAGLIFIHPKQGGYTVYEVNLDGRSHAEGTPVKFTRVITQPPEILRGSPVKNTGVTPVKNPNTKEKVLKKSYKEKSSIGAAAAIPLLDKKEEQLEPAISPLVEKLAGMLHEAGYQRPQALNLAGYIDTHRAGRNAEMALANAILKARQPGVKSKLAFLTTLIKAPDFYQDNTNGAAAPARTSESGQVPPLQSPPKSIRRSLSSIKVSLVEKHGLAPEIADRIQPNRLLIERRLTELEGEGGKYALSKLEMQEKEFLADFLLEVDKDLTQEQERLKQKDLERGTSWSERLEILYPGIRVGGGVASQFEGEESAEKETVFVLDDPF